MIPVFIQPLQNWRYNEKCGDYSDSYWFLQLGLRLGSLGSIVSELCSRETLIGS